MGTRRKARIAAFQALYAWQETQDDREKLIGFDWLDDKLDDETLVFASLLTSGTLDRIDEVDEHIKTHLKKWSFERISRVDLAILRTGAYALLFQKDIPASVTIDEAVEIAKKFSSPESYRFVNGVLDGIRKADLS
ncbi:MAG: transcription antitermination factor NusB [Spirochaetaceae bacterium]|nr:transcription antitermination factor NusB [Spirochaetaceae bacterium]MDT8298395.1 transcription antitermination factor NusB [Spirochaetaceae bacterium]